MNFSHPLPPSPALAEKAFALIGSPYFRWMTGMPALRYAPGGFADHLHREFLIQGPKDAQTAIDWGCIPELDSPATLGCLLALIRERYGDPNLVPVYANSHWHLLGKETVTEVDCLIGALL